MTTYENCKTLRRCIVNRAAEVMNYTNWSDDLAAKQIREIPAALLEKIGKVNIAELTAEQMDDLGFGRWSEENPMRLIPLWLYPFLPDEIETECIDGKKSVLKKADMDNDHRFGCLAYGIWPTSKVLPPAAKGKIMSKETEMKLPVGQPRIVRQSSDTPETESLIGALANMPDDTCCWVEIGWLRRLERERDQARLALNSLPNV